MVWRSPFTNNERHCSAASATEMFLFGSWCTYVCIWKVDCFVAFQESGHVTHTNTHTHTHTIRLRNMIISAIFIFVRKPTGNISLIPCNICIGIFYGIWYHYVFSVTRNFNIVNVKIIINRRNFYILRVMYIQKSFLYWINSSRMVCNHQWHILISCDKIIIDTVQYVQFRFICRLIVSIILYCYMYLFRW